MIHFVVKFFSPNLASLRSFDCLRALSVSKKHALREKCFVWLRQSKIKTCTELRRSIENPKSVDG
jgi:hypothetical protein